MKLDHTSSNCRSVQPENTEPINNGSIFQFIKGISKKLKPTLISTKITKKNGFMNLNTVFFEQQGL